MALWNNVTQALYAWVQSASGLDTAHVIWGQQSANAPEGPFITLTMGNIEKIGATDEETYDPVVSTTVTDADFALPQGTIDVVSTTGFAASGAFQIPSDQGYQTITYTGTTATSFTGCSGGAGNVETGAEISQGTAGADITINENGVRRFSLSVQCFAGRSNEVGDSAPYAILSKVRQALEAPSFRSTLQLAGLGEFDSDPIQNLSRVAGTIFEPRAMFEVRFLVVEVFGDITTFIATVNGNDLIPGTYTGP